MYQNRNYRYIFRLLTCMILLLLSILLLHTTSTTKLQAEKSQPAYSIHHSTDSIISTPVQLNIADMEEQQIRTIDYAYEYIAIIVAFFFLCCNISYYNISDSPYSQSNHCLSRILSFIQDTDGKKESLLHV